VLTPALDDFEQRRRAIDACSPMQPGADAVTVSGKNTLAELANADARSPPLEPRTFAAIF
jgi:hypothetical protein